MTLNRTNRKCDGMHRRELLHLGAAAFCGLTLADFYRADAQSPMDPSYRRKSIVNVWLAGGASHLDTFDMKPNAPVEFRGEFRQIATRMPGVQICEYMPRIAERLDRMALIRSLTGTVDSHDGAMCATGYPPGSLRNIGGRPNIGSVVSKIQGPTNGNAPTAVAMISAYNPSEQAYSRSAGFLGRSFDCYTPTSADGRANLMARNITSERMDLLSRIDTVRRDLDTRGNMEAMDAYTQRAVQFVTSREFADALDITREPLSVRNRYGIGFGTSPLSRNTLGLQNARFLMARRLIECGSRCVNLTWEEEGERRWDTHSNNFNALRTELLPSFDIGLSAFFDDLEARGMLEDVMVLVWGEFGRTPRINGGAGRDHWGRVYSTVLAGGGIRGGAVVGRGDLLTFMEQRFADQRAGKPFAAHRTAELRTIRLMRARQAFDVATDWERAKERYGDNKFGRGCFTALKLVEAGVSFVEIGHIGYDTHVDNFPISKANYSILDPAWGSLMDDLHQRGLLRDTLVVWTSEFGRTPAINNRAGRDRFGRAWTIVLAGGCIRGGQHYGASIRDGFEVEENPVSEGDLFATIYRAMGINPRVRHYLGSRPIWATPEGSRPIQQLLG